MSNTVGLVDVGRCSGRGCHSRRLTLKRALVLVIAAAGAVVVQQRLKTQRAERELWAEITDDPATPASAG